MTTLEALLLLTRLLCLGICAWGVYVVLRYDMEPRRRLAGGHVLGGCLAMIGLMGWILVNGEPETAYERLIANGAVCALVYGIGKFILCTQRTCKSCPMDEGAHEGRAT